MWVNFAPQGKWHKTAHKSTTIGNASNDSPLIIITLNLLSSSSPWLQLCRIGKLAETKERKKPKPQTSATTNHQQSRSNPIMNKLQAVKRWRQRDREVELKWFLLSRTNFPHHDILESLFLLRRFALIPVASSLEASEAKKKSPRKARLMKRQRIASCFNSPFRFAN